MIRKHHHVPVKEGISSLVGWMNSQSNNLQFKIHFFAHSASVERNAIPDNCAEADHSFLHWVEFHDTIHNFKKPCTSLTTTDPKVSLCTQLEQHPGMSLDSISHRFGFGSELHNAADDTIFLIAAMAMFFRCLSPQTLYDRILIQLDSKTGSTGTLRKPHNPRRKRVNQLKCKLPPKRLSKVPH